MTKMLGYNNKADQIGIVIPNFGLCSLHMVIDL